MRSSTQISHKTPDSIVAVRGWTVRIVGFSPSSVTDKIGNRSSLPIMFCKDLTNSTGTDRAARLD
jgi:hypothetical protein